MFAISLAGVKDVIQALTESETDLLLSTVRYSACDMKLNELD